MLEYFGLLVKDFSDRGENEKELYRNYKKALPRFATIKCISQIFQPSRIKKKDNNKSKDLRALAQNAFDKLEYPTSLRLFTKSLQHAVYYSEDFLKAITSRINVSHTMHNHKSCVQDSNWLPASLRGKDSVRSILQACLTESPPSCSNDFTCDTDETLMEEPFTKTSFTTGDVVFVSKPYAWAPISCSGRCQNCLKETEILLPCRQCVEFGFCSNECQEEAWKSFHQWECFGFRANFFKFSEWQLPALRMLFKRIELNSDGLAIPSLFEKRNAEQLIQAAAVATVTLMYLKENTEFFNAVKSAPIFSKLNEEEIEETLGGWFITHHLQLLSHAISMQSLTGQLPAVATYATAICPTFASKKHSCKPNTTFYFSNGFLCVKAITDIQDGMEAFVSHRGICVQNMNFKERKEATLECLGFICECPSCTLYKENELYVCCTCHKECGLPDCKDDLYLCLTCDEVFPVPLDYKQAKEEIRTNVLMYDVLKDLELLNDSLKLAKQIFAFKNIFLLEVYDKIIQHHITSDNYREFLQAIRASFKTRESLYGGLSMKFGLDLYQHTWHILRTTTRFSSWMKLEDFQDLLDCALKIIKKLNSIFEIIYPPFLPTIREIEITVQDQLFFSVYMESKEEIKSELPV